MPVLGTPAFFPPARISCCAKRGKIAAANERSSQIAQ
jgi:hypothetical protein